MTFVTKERGILHHHHHHPHPIRDRNLQVTMMLAQRTKERSLQGAKEKHEQAHPEQGIGEEGVNEDVALPHGNPGSPLAIMIATTMNFQQVVKKDIQKYHLILLSWHVYVLDRNPAHSKALTRLEMNLANIRMLSPSFELPGI